MLEELNAKPQRKGVKEEAKAAGKRAYDRAYKKAAIDTARAEGAAQGTTDAVIDAPSSAVEAARARAIGGGSVDAPPAAAPAPEESGTTSVPDGQRFVEVPARGRTYRVPDPQWYSASQEQRDGGP